MKQKWSPGAKAPEPRVDFYWKGKKHSTLVDILNLLSARMAPPLPRPGRFNSLAED